MINDGLIGGNSVCVLLVGDDCWSQLGGQSLKLIRVVHLRLLRVAHGGSAPVAERRVLWITYKYKKQSINKRTILQSSSVPTRGSSMIKLVT